VRDACGYDRGGALTELHHAALDAIRARMQELERERDEHDASFNLYDRAIRRGTEAWHAAGGDPDVWPDVGALVKWILEERDILRARVEEITQTAKNRLAELNVQRARVERLEELAREIVHDVLIDFEGDVVNVGTLKSVKRRAAAVLADDGE
jgi:hypothetical protein